jgi:hypothetical protein
LQANKRTSANIVRGGSATILGNIASLFLRDVRHRERGLDRPAMPAQLTQIGFGDCVRDRHLPFVDHNHRRTMT